MNDARFKINLLIFVFILFFPLPIKASIKAADWQAKLEHCLDEEWGVDRHTAGYLIKKFLLCCQNSGSDSIIDDFIAKSKKIGINFAIPHEVQSLSPEDGVLRSPKQHLVVFENLYIRILWGSTLPGEREPFHVHQWKSLMVVLKPTTFEIEYPNGAIEIWEGTIGVYELPANERYACTNIGHIADEALRFEIKE